MKKIFIASITVICLLAITLVAPIFVTAAEEESKIDANTAAQLDYTDTYFYDRISERQQWCYNWLKDYYDSFDGEPGDYRFDFTHLLPSGFTMEESDALFTDFLVGELALRADYPLYETKGNIGSAGTDLDAATQKGSWFFIEITHTDLRTADADAQVAARIEQIVQTIGEGDRYTKLRKLSHYILSNTFYDPYGMISDSGDWFNALATRGIYYDITSYGLFIKNIAVCDGFADSVKVLCNALDIPCIIIGNNAHAWNMVQMEDGSWYHFDMTRDKLGWDGYTDIDDFFANVFLKSAPFDNRYNPPYYTIGVNHVYYANEFPEESDHHYVYTGSTTDFSYVEAPSTYTPGEPTFSYKVNSDGMTCTIINYEGRQEGDLIIPETIDGYTVTAIEAYSFYYCTGFAGKLVIPDTVTSIGKAAFAGCYNLASVELPSGLDEIGYGAFIGCKGLTEVNLPETLVKIDEYAFYDCDKLTSVAFGGHIQSVGTNAFAEIAASVIVKAPAGSAAEKYATENGIAFEMSGTMCSFVDADGKWEWDENGHFHVCEHGVKFDRQEHSGKQGDMVNCGDECVTCGIKYCVMNGFTENIEMQLVGAHPATCISPEYTGDLVCSCGAGGRPGEFVGEPSGEHTPVDGWKSAPDNTKHYQTCLYCGVTFNEAEHSGGTATFTEKARCEVCGVEYGELVPHDHRGGVASETERAKCEVCGVEYGELLPAKPNENVSDNDENKPDQPADTPDNTWVWVVVGAICVAAACALVMVALMRKKKR